MRRRRTQKKSRKVKGGACGSCMMPQQPIQSGGKCPCAAVSKLPITFGGVRRNRTRNNKNNKRVRFA
jgi:hypothetical protein